MTKIYHFHNGTGGGVLSVIKNLLKYSVNPLIENHIIHAVNKEQISTYTVESIEGAVTQQVFYYAPKNNFYYTSKQIAKLLPDNKAVIVAHDWVELGMVSNLGLQNPVVQLLHGDFDYYYELAKKNISSVDLFICISPTIFKKLKSILIGREKDISYINFPVPVINKKNTVNEVLHLIYYVRDLNDHRKQFSVILEIANKLAIEKDKYFFTIAGGGHTQKSFFDVWPSSMKSRVKYLGAIPNEQIVHLLPSQDVFLLPSLSEGLPVSLIEAMKAGVVPLVTNWDGAVDELITQGSSGYYLKIGAVDDYVEAIKKLEANRGILHMISNNCTTKANLIFDPWENTKKFENVFLTLHQGGILRKVAKKVYGSKLDHIWIPNTITKLIRNFKFN
jgi:glycosyltransferase involved in cell wall biosynthesis